MRHERRAKTLPLPYRAALVAVDRAKKSVSGSSAEPKQACEDDDGDDGGSGGGGMAARYAQIGRGRGLVDLYLSRFLLSTEHGTAGAIGCDVTLPVLPK